ncbi:disease resistance protein [Striga asiatica]|uniref:Disease resistance protein n=1 Tax=Striga asiatica TaxID=4170 RepID=A0A5A7QT50_STRAF|nr:disease resistance protein [Striga asiatica]
MAAYAALVSLMNIIEQIQHHPHPPISLDNKQVESLTVEITFLEDFLENYPTSEALESRIANAAYAVEDIIEFHVVDQILPPPRSRGPISTIDFNQRLQRVIQDFETIKRDVADVKEKSCKKSISSGSSVKSNLVRHDIMVGLDDIKLDIMDKLTGGSCSRQIIPIVGMGGIGKTTLARNVYLDSCVKHHFDVRAWATISQEYDAKEILLELLVCQKDNAGRKESMNHMSEHELGEMLYKSLVGRRYLIVLDDLWSIEAWDKLKFFFPDNDNRSRMMMTTRLSNLAFEITGTHGYTISLLDDDKSWELLCKIVFGSEPCPTEFEEIGKKIAENCKGLPLSIVVIGGLLAKSKPAHEQYWQHIAENLDSIVKTEDDKRCSKILQMSYDQLPVHLKPCFLYMGVYPEDCEIHVSNLMKLWVAEGFLKPIAGKSLEQAAEEYFNELIDRNLVFASKRGYNSKIKYCKIHDLLMNLCIRESQKHRFLFVTSLYKNHIPQNISNQRRVVIHQGTNPQMVHALKRYAPLVRSFTRKSHSVAESLNFRLMRVFNGNDRNCYYSLLSCPGLVNCRYIDSLNIPRRDITRVPLFWNLQTLIVTSGSESIEPLQIWKMPQLRHVKLDLLHLPDPDEENFILENLQKLSTVRNFKCRQGVVERLPNIKKLRLFYDERLLDWPSCRLENIECFEKLDSLSLHFPSKNRPGRDYLSENLVFPRLVKKLTLWCTGLGWEDMARKIGWLPNLEVLRLNVDAFVGPVWETVEGQFCSLKFLLVSCCMELERWKVESSHFPCLEKVVLRYLRKLKELPREIGDVMTLRSIEVEYCSDEAVICARDVVEEQGELGNEELQVFVVLSKKNEEVERLASRNFQVKIK